MFTHRNFSPQKSWAQKVLRSIFTQTLLHTCSSYTERLCFPFLISYLSCSPSQVFYCLYHSDFSHFQCFPFFCNIKTSMCPVLPLWLGEYLVYPAIGIRSKGIFAAWVSQETLAVAGSGCGGGAEHGQRGPNSRRAVEASARNDLWKRWAMGHGFWDRIHWSSLRACNGVVFFFVCVIVIWYSYRTYNPLYNQ